MVDLLWQSWRIDLPTGDFTRIASLTFKRVLMLVGQRPSYAWRLSRSFAPVLGLGQISPMRDGALASFDRSPAQSEEQAVAYALRRKRGTPESIRRASLLEDFGVVAMGLFFIIIARLGDIRWTDRSKRSREVIVTRAMGGIGDFLMMTPSARARSRASRAAPRSSLQFRARISIFLRIIPNVELIDIDGPPIDPSEFRRWANLTICPAAAYESRKRPHIKIGRIDLFAGGMGISRPALLQHGTQIEVHLDAVQIAFRNKFITDHGLGRRPLVGVQPYSRELYRDHPGNWQKRVIEALARDYDVIVFHHLSSGLPSSPGIVFTAGLPLANSLALVSSLNAMVSVDSSFLHAASAFDIPVVALFGPTDGRIRTIHIRNATVLSLRQEFPCSLCWRNEDIPCAVTGNTGISPCMAGISQDAIIRAVAAAIGGSGTWEQEKQSGKWRSRATAPAH